MEGDGGVGVGVAWGVWGVWGGGRHEKRVGGREGQETGTKETGKEVKRSLRVSSVCG